MPIVQGFDTLPPRTFSRDLQNATTTSDPLNCSRIILVPLTCLEHHVVTVDTILIRLVLSSHPSSLTFPTSHRIPSMHTELVHSLMLQNPNAQPPGVFAEVARVYILLSKVSFQCTSPQICTLVCVGRNFPIRCRYHGMDYALELCLLAVLLVEKGYQPLSETAIDVF
jgi:hypothetical protein